MIENKRYLKDIVCFKNDYLSKIYVTFIQNKEINLFLASHKMHVKNDNIPKLSSSLCSYAIFDKNTGIINRKYMKTIEDFPNKIVLAKNIYDRILDNMIDINRYGPFIVTTDEQRRLRIDDSLVRDIGKEILSIDTTIHISLVIFKLSDIPYPKADTEFVFFW